MKRVIFGVFLFFSLCFWVGCNNIDDSNDGKANDIADSSEYGSLTITTKNKNDATNSSRYISVSDITKALVTVSGDGIAVPITKEVVTENGKGSCTIEKIPIGKNRLVTIQGYKDAKQITGMTLYSVVEIKKGENTANIDAETSKKGKVYQALIKSGITDFSGIDDVIPSVNVALVNDAQIVVDKKANKLKEKNAYITKESEVSFDISKKIETSVSAPAYTGDGYRVHLTNCSWGTKKIYYYNKSNPTAAGNDNEVSVWESMPSMTVSGSDVYYDLTENWVKPGTTMIIFYGGSDVNRYPADLQPGEILPLNVTGTKEATFDLSSKKWSFPDMTSSTQQVEVSGLDAGTVIYINDPLSKKYTLKGDEKDFSIENVAPGIWTVYKVIGISIKEMGTIQVGIDGTEITQSEHKINLLEKGSDVSTGGVPVNPPYSPSDDDDEDDTPLVTDKIIVHAKYSAIYYWTNQTDGQHDAMESEGDDWNKYEIYKTKASIIFKDTVGTKDWTGQTADLSIPNAGEYWFVENGKSDAKGHPMGDFVTVNPDKPSPPTVYIDPTGNEISLTGSITIKLTNNKANITNATVTISGAVNKTYSLQDFSDDALTIKIGAGGLGITDVGKVIYVQVTASNSEGKKSASANFKTAETAGGIVSDPNELRIYQVMVASFQDGDPSIGYSDMWGPTGTKGGDLQGVINALDYIKELGCNAVWMTPIFDSAGVSEKLAATGYFATDYFNVDPKFGTNAKFNELVEAAHSKNISIILDGVFGHNGGSQGGQMKASPQRSGIQNPGIRPSTSNPVNYASDQNTLKYYSDVARYWITEYKIDGWRLDQCYQVAFGENAKGNTSDNCNTGGHNYWYDIRKVVEAASSSNGAKGTDWGTLGYMVGEHWRGDASTIQNGTVTPGTSRGFGLQSCFDFPAYYKLVQGFACEHGGKSTGNIGDALSYTYSTFTQKGYSCKEDDNSYKTYYPNVMLSNHDLYRIGQLIKEKHGCSYGTDDYVKRNAVLIAAQCAYTGPITIYYGDEIGDTSEGKGGNSDNLARTSGKITGFSTWEQRLHDMTQKCLTARAEHKALWSGSNETVTSNANFYVAKKQCDGETIYIAFNNGTSSQSFTMQGSGIDLLSSTNESVSGTVSVPALTARYVLVK